MNMMRREIEDIKNDSCPQSLGRSNMTTMFLKSVGISVGKCSCTICYQQSQLTWERSRADLYEELLTWGWAGSSTDEQDQFRN